MFFFPIKFSVTIVTYHIRNLTKAKKSQEDEKTING